MTKYATEISHFANAQNDKIWEADDKSVKDCDDKVTESKNDKSNYSRDISPALNITKQTNHNMTNTNELESQIDDLVYQLYDLDSTEIQIIQSLKKSNLLTKTP